MSTLILMTPGECRHNAFHSVRIYRAKEETTTSQWFASCAHNELSPYRRVILADILILVLC